MLELYCVTPLKCCMQLYSISYLLYAFFWVIPRCLNFICWHFGTLCLFHLHRQVGVKNVPMKMEQTECSETSAYKFRCQRITQKKAYNIQNVAKVWNQEYFILTSLHHFCDVKLWYMCSNSCRLYEGRLVSNAHSEISRKRDHVFKQTKVGSKVQYFSYKLTYLFFDIVTLSFNTFFPT